MIERDDSIPSLAELLDELDCARRLGSDNQRRALISLLVDDDPAIYGMVRAKLLSYGPPAVQWLRPHTLSSDPRMRRRAQEIVDTVERLATAPKEAPIRPRLEGMPSSG